MKLKSDLGDSEFLHGETKGLVALEDVEEEGVSYRETEREGLGSGIVNTEVVEKVLQSRKGVGKLQASRPVPDVPRDVLTRYGLVVLLCRSHA